MNFPKEENDVDTYLKWNWLLKESIEELDLLVRIARRDRINDWLNETITSQKFSELIKGKTISSEGLSVERSSEEAKK